MNTQQLCFRTMLLIFALPTYVNGTVKESFSEMNGHVGVPPSVFCENMSISCCLGPEWHIGYVRTIVTYWQRATGQRILRCNCANIGHVVTG